MIFECNRQIVTDSSEEVSLGSIFECNKQHKKKKKTSKERRSNNYTTHVITKTSVDAKTGLYISRRESDQSIIIKEIMPGSPAASTCLKAGMRLVLVNKKPVLPETMSLQQVAEMLLTAPGGEVSVTCCEMDRIPLHDDRRTEAALIRPPCYEKRVHFDQFHYY